MDASVVCQPSHVFMKAPVDGVDPVGFFDRARRPTGWWADAPAFGLVYNGRLRREAATPGVFWRRMKTTPDRTVPAGFGAGISARFPRGNTRGRRGGDWRRGSGTVPAGDGVAPPSLASGNGAGRNGAGNGAGDGRHGVWATRFRRGTGRPVDACRPVWCLLSAARFRQACGGGGVRRWCLRNGAGNGAAYRLHGIRRHGTGTASAGVRGGGVHEIKLRIIFLRDWFVVFYGCVSLRRSLMTTSILSSSRSGLFHQFLLHILAMFHPLLSKNS